MYSYKSVSGSQFFLSLASHFVTPHHISSHLISRGYLMQTRSEIVQSSLEYMHRNSNGEAVEVLPSQNPTVQHPKRRRAPYFKRPKTWHNNVNGKSYFDSPGRVPSRLKCIPLFLSRSFIDIFVPFIIFSVVLLNVRVLCPAKS